MEIKHFIGVDVSKNTLDIAVVADAKKQLHYQIKNTAKDIKAFLPRLLYEAKATIADTVFCMEYTGIYNNLLIRHLQAQGGKIWMESAVQISKCTGVTRGKNDKVDSGRIALYAYTNRHAVKLWVAPRAALCKIAALLSQRSRLLKAKMQLTSALGEQKLFMDKDITKTLAKHLDKPVAILEKQITAVEKDIVDTIKADETLQRLYQIATSVNGIGPVTAAYLLVTTNEFTGITEGKKYACYAGVAPFEHSSGSSVRGRTRVSHHANKTMKTLLHLAALAAIQMKGELREFYQRKVSEEKNKMSVLNAVRNKLILRIFACVHKNKLFEKNYSCSLV